MVTVFRVPLEEGRQAQEPVGNHSEPLFALFFFCSQASQSNQAKFSLWFFPVFDEDGLQGPASFFSSSDTFLSTQVHELLGDDKEKFNIPEDSSKKTMIHVFRLICI